MGGRNHASLMSGGWCSQQSHVATAGSCLISRCSLLEAQQPRRGRRVIHSCNVRPGPGAWRSLGQVHLSDVVYVCPRVALRCESSCHLSLVMSQMCGDIMTCDFCDIVSDVCDRKYIRTFSRSYGHPSGHGPDQSRRSLRGPARWVAEGPRGRRGVHRVGLEELPKVEGYLRRDNVFRPASLAIAFRAAPSEHYPITPQEYPCVATAACPRRNSLTRTRTRTRTSRS